MKKIFQLLLLPAFTLVLASCKKEGPDMNLTTRENLGNTQRVGIIPIPWKYSDWLSMDFEKKINPDNSQYLEGIHLIKEPFIYDTGSYIQLVYQRVGSAESGYFYSSLPYTITDDSGIGTDVNFNLNFTEFSILVKYFSQDNSNDLPVWPEVTADFEKYEFRYIIIPKEWYSNLNIDWSDYMAVAAVFNL